VTGPERKPTPPDMAAALRRAAALFAHWRAGDISATGEIAVLDELDLGDAEGWTMLVCALLQVGSNMAKAAKDGREDAYLAYVVREASLDEVVTNA
jgi:hypothetical protein